MITVITGGARSGKSRLAQKRALQLSPEPVFIATAEVMDDEFAERVKRHKDERGKEWTVFESNKDLHTLPLKNRVVVVDCVTLWLSKIFSERQQHTENSLQSFKKQVDKLFEVDCTLILVTNEIGMGVHAHNEIGRKFTDLQGWANQYIASKADEVICMISGLSMILKKPVNNA